MVSLKLHRFWIKRIALNPASKTGPFRSHQNPSDSVQLPHFHHSSRSSPAPKWVRSADFIGKP
jgi:hypothetical protein